MFGKSSKPVGKKSDQDRSTVRRQPISNLVENQVGRQPAAQLEYQKEILDETAAEQFLYRKENSNQFPRNCKEMKETFALPIFLTPTVESPTSSRFCDNPMGKEEKL